MTHGELRSQLDEWCEPLRRWGGNVEILDTELGAKVKWLTPRYCYVASAHLRENDAVYLGGSVSTREPRPGEDWNRGNDLSDGAFSRETFEAIVADALAYELADSNKQPVG